MLPHKEEKSICILGDLLIYDHLGPDSEKAAALLKESDIVFGNLETTLATKGYPAAKSITLRTRDHSILEDFEKMNIKALSLANNHTMDFGFEGLFETIQVLDKHNIAHAGAGNNLEEALKLAILQLGDLKIAFLACSSHLISHSIAGDDRPGIVPLRVNLKVEVLGREQQESVVQAVKIMTEADEEDLNNLLRIVEKARKETDFIVVSTHWNSPIQPLLPPRRPWGDFQCQVAHKLIDAGADIIMGHGDHALQGIEVYKKRYIFYSLGHFVYHIGQPRRKRPSSKMESAWSKTTADPRARWRFKETAIGKIVFSGSNIERVEVIPIVINENGDPKIAYNESAVSILNFLIVESRFLGTSLRIKDNRGIIDA